MTMTRAPFAPEGDLIRRILAVLVAALLAGTSLWLLAPFLPAFIWGATIAVAGWPLLERLQARLGGRRGQAVTVITIVMLLAFFVPLLVLMASLVDYGGDAAHWIAELTKSGFPPAPAWVRGLPVVGSQLAGKWDGLAAMSGGDLAATMQPWLAQAGGWLLAKAGGLLALTIQFLLTAVLTTILFLNGERVGHIALLTARKLGATTARR